MVSCSELMPSCPDNGTRIEVHGVRRRRAAGPFAILVLALWLAAPPQRAAAQEEPDGGAEAAEAHRTGLLELFKAGGLIGYVIVGLSVAALALTLEQLFSLRRAAFSPHGMAEQLNELISRGEYRQAEQLCLENRVLLTSLVRAGLQEIRLGYSAVEKAMEEAALFHGARLYRRIELLSVLASLSTMLGLLGTVVGLIKAFREVAESGGMAQAADLATGIYQALVTTVEGLLVAIPCMALFALFRNRLDQLVAETSLLAEYAFAGYKRARVSRRSAETARAREARN